MKRIVTVQDLSCLGKCALTVALPVISAMGVEAAVLPTAVLSTHTAFPSPAVTDLTDMIDRVQTHWEQIGASFDGICTGYLASTRQVQQVLKLADRFPGFLLTDPVMGDNGKLYSRIDLEFAEQMRLLCARADMILPNLTEACQLTGTPYREDWDEASLKALLKQLTDLGCRIAAITGIAFSDGRVGVMGYEKATDTYYSYAHQRLEQGCHGTGDIFCAVCAGALALGKSWQASLQLAADFTLRCLQLTPLSQRDRRYGVCFEQALPYLYDAIN